MAVGRYINSLLLTFGFVSTFSANAENSIDDRIIFREGHPFIQDADAVFLDRRNFYHIDKEIEKNDSIVYPGTKWCGRGSSAESYDDLGPQRDTDICCRDHYYCDSIAAGEEKYGVLNKNNAKRWNCRCDKDFAECLKNVNDTTSNKVGKNYFSYTNNCFQEDYPTIDCRELKSLVFQSRCMKYIYDTSQPKIYQWFDVPFFDSESIPNMTDKMDYDEFYRKMSEYLNFN